MVEIKRMIEAAAVYVPYDSESIRIDYIDDDAFFGTGEESGESYKILYEDVNLEVDQLYKLVLMNG